MFVRWPLLGTAERWKVSCDTLTLLFFDTCQIEYSVHVFELLIFFFFPPLQKLPREWLDGLVNKKWLDERVEKFLKLLGLHE